jgi:hypothetical protein
MEVRNHGLARDHEHDREGVLEHVLVLGVDRQRDRDPQQPRLQGHGHQHGRAREGGLS